MATGAVYRVPFQRRKKTKTDYRLRRLLLKSGKPRLVVRKSNKYVSAQLMAFLAKGDSCVVSAHSKELLKYGWTFSGKNLPACYLTGYLFGKKALKNNPGMVVADFGLFKTQKTEKFYALLRGAKDAGLDISINESTLPPENRIKGEHIKQYAETLKDDKENKQFGAKYNAAKMTDVFEEVKKKIEGA